MNLFIWCVIADGEIHYGMMKTVDGSTARGILEAKYHGRKIQKMEIKGVATKSFEFDIVEGINVKDCKAPGPRG